MLTVIFFMMLIVIGILIGMFIKSELDKNDIQESMNRLPSAEMEKLHYGIIRRNILSNLQQIEIINSKVDMLLNEKKNKKNLVD